MKLIVSKKAGYCFGVKRAMDRAEKLLENKQETNVVSLGALIHNKQAIEKLEAKGLLELNEIKDIQNGSTVIIRSHGLGEHYYRELTDKNCNIEDATCPFVKKIQDIACKNKKMGKKIIIIGDKHHPEIEGINLWAGGDCIIGKDCSDFLFLKGSEDSYIVVTQTTFSVEKYQEIKKYLKDNLKDVVFYDTICDATKVRQEDAMKIAQEVDAMIVIGGKHSSNTKKLYRLCENICKTFLIETVNDIDVDEIKFYDIIGVTAGASTPDFVINEVIDFIVHIKK